MSATDWGKAIAKSALPVESIQRGPWRGAVESRSADQIEPDSADGAGSSNFLYMPSTGTWRRRGGQVIQFDTIVPDPIEPGAEGYGALYGFDYGGS